MEGNSSGGGSSVGGGGVAAAAAVVTPGAAGVVGGGGNDVELMCKTLQVEHKLFYFDLKENPRGRYLKISEKTSSTRSTIIVPSSGISWFLDLFNYYVNSDEHDLFSKELQLDTKATLRHSTSGTSRDEGWASFRNILADINEASRLYMLSNQQNSESSERLVGLSDDVGAGFISGHSTQQPAPPTSELNVDRAVDLPTQDEIGNLGVSKVIRVDQKRFFFDLGSNNRGHFLRISEVAGSDRSSIILPLSGLKQFHEIVGHFVEITKDRIEGMGSANVRTVDPPQR
ncbi:unnamed protein product [Linum tenue]|uniref:Transcription factor Pur-alpha 1 n=1 Tax=Linum tenue TaxID=586396 RepID=A0AAV0HGU0_9ROSI|nr:unnamed protein product [Linum tenue]